MKYRVWQEMGIDQRAQEIEADSHDISSEWYALDLLDSDGKTIAYFKNWLWFEIVKSVDG